MRDEGDSSLQAGSGHSRHNGICRGIPSSVTYEYANGMMEWPTACFAGVSTVRVN